MHPIWLCLLLAAGGGYLCSCLLEPIPAQADSPGQHDDDHDHDSSELTFEASLQRVVRASRQRFRPIKSFRIEMHPGRDFWYEVKASLPGAGSCRIYEHPELIYTCEWSNNKAKASMPAYSDMVKKVEAALGEGWTRTKTTSARKMTRFEPKRLGLEGVIEVLARQNSGAPGLQVIVYPAPLSE